MIAIAVTLLPQPDSPTRPMVAPAGTSNDTSSTTATLPSSPVRVVATAGGKHYTTVKEVKVTIGGCGG